MANEHKHGSMDISSQLEVFSGFVRWTVWVVGIVFFVLLFLAVFAS